MAVPMAPLEKVDDRIKGRERNLTMALSRYAGRIKPGDTKMSRTTSIAKSMIFCLAFAEMFTPRRGAEHERCPSPRVKAKIQAPRGIAGRSIHGRALTTARITGRDGRCVEEDEPPAEAGDFGRALSSHR